MSNLAQRLDNDDVKDTARRRETYAVSQKCHVHYSSYVRQLWTLAVRPINGSGGQSCPLVAVVLVGVIIVGSTSLVLLLLLQLFSIGTRFRIFNLDESPQVYLQAMVHTSDNKNTPFHYSSWKVPDQKINSQRQSSNNVSENKNADNLAVFYHIYIPPDGGLTGITNARRIVEDQLQQLGSSYAARYAKQRPNQQTSTSFLQVFYTTVGAKNVLTQSYMDHLCSQNELNCIHLRHVLHGFEEITLEEVYGYCRQQQDANQEARVIYLHSKGSFHSQKGQNDNWRWHMTKAVSSQDCITPPTKSNSENNSTLTCHVCGLLFYPLWTMFFPGNFWTAQCRYIATYLDAPSVFRKKMTLVVDKMKTRVIQENETEPTLNYRRDWQSQLEDTAGKFRTKLQSITQSGGYLGIDRYAAEHWIASHPAVVPCDMSKTADLEFWWNQVAASDSNASTHDVSGRSSHANDASTLQWDFAPRHPIDADWFRLRKDFIKGGVRNATIDLRREYFYLTGFLFKWQELYGYESMRAALSRDSWIWSWFVDGDFWRDILDRHGEESVKFLLSASPWPGNDGPAAEVAFQKIV